jgi:hypothetical protein
MSEYIEIIRDDLIGSAEEAEGWVTAGRMCARTGGKKDSVQALCVQMNFSVNVSNGPNN